MSLLLTNNLVVPLPDLSGDGFTDGAENSEALHLATNVLITSTLQQTQSSGSNVELSDLVLVDDIPVSRKVGVGGGSLENNSGNTEDKRGVDDVCVTSDPTDVTTTEVTVAVVNVEDVLASHGSSEQVTSGGVHDTLGLASGTRGVEQEQRVLGIHGLGSDVAGPLVDLLVPPNIASLLHRHVSAGALEDQTLAHIGALLEGIVDDLLGTNELATTLAFVGSDDDSGVSVDDTVAQRIGRETGKDNGVNSTDTCAGKNGNQCLWNHGHVDSNSVSLANTGFFEGPGDSGDLSKQLAIGNVATIFGFISLVNDGYAVGVLERMAIDQVVRGIQLTLSEPGVVASAQRTAVDGRGLTVPCQKLFGAITPELGRFRDGLLVELLVFLEVWLSAVSSMGHRTDGEQGSW